MLAPHRGGKPVAVSIMLSILGLGAACALLYNFAVYALPAFVGLSVGFWTMDAGAGPLGGIAVGLFAGIAVLVIGQVIFTSSRSPATRWLVAIIFAAPAAYAGYHALLQVLGLGMPPGLWQQAFAIVGALTVGCTAVGRLASDTGGWTIMPDSTEGRSEVH